MRYTLSNWVICIIFSLPIKLLYEEQMKYPAANNWANNMMELREKYNFPADTAIKEISKDSWKRMVKTTVTGRAFESLKHLSKSKKKTQCLEYGSTLETQEYLKKYPAEVVNVIFKLRSKSTNVLDNRGIHDQVCRLCGSALETQQHAINCATIAKNCSPLSLSTLYGEVDENDEEVREIVKRYLMFEKQLKQKLSSHCDEKCV